MKTKLYCSFLLIGFSFFAGGCGGETTIIPSSTIAKLEVTPANASIGLGAALSYNATAIRIDGIGTDITGTVDWNSSNATVATVEIDGTAEALSKGTTTISAVFNDVVGSTILTVVDAALQSIVISPNDANITAGASVQLTAAGNYTDGTTQDLSSKVAWSSSDLSVATVEANGSVNPWSPGSVTIMAALDDINATALVTVR